MTSATHAAVEQRRLPYLDGLRGLASLFVVVHHIFSSVYQHRAVPVYLQSLQFGNYSVVAFLVLSGYSLSLSTARNANRLPSSTATFYRKRIIRIVPPYLAALILSTALTLTIIGAKTGTPWDSSAPVSWLNTVIHAMLLQDITILPHTPGPNYAFWSIAPEFHIYVVFPLLLVILRNGAFGNVKLVMIGVISSLTSIYLLAYGFRAFQYDLLLLAPFIFGMLAATEAGSRKPIDPRNMWSVLAAVSLIGIAVLSAVMTYPIVNKRLWLVDPIVGAAVAATLVALRKAPDHNAFKRFFSRGPMLTVGAFSYSLYLVHAPLIQVVWKYGLNPTGLVGAPAFVVLLVTALPVALLGAWFFFQLFERPFMHGRWPHKNAGTA